MHPSHITTAVAKASEAPARSLSTFTVNELNRKLVGALNRRDRSRQGSTEDAQALAEVTAIRNAIRNATKKEHTMSTTTPEPIALHTAPSGKVTKWGAPGTEQIFRSKSDAQSFINGLAKHEATKLEPADEPPSGTIVIPEPAKDRSAAEIMAERRAAAYAAAANGKADDDTTDEAPAPAKPAKAKLTDDERKARRRERRAARLAKLTPEQAEARKAKRAAARKAKREARKADAK
jgi:hypothetical protein